jgi:hydrogenase nickel incorporation protein HypA/HybF
VHEYSVVQALLEKVEAEARRHGAVAVHAVVVRLGELSGVEPALLSSAWELVREETVCANATLTLERSAAAWTCSACGYRPRPGESLLCAACGVPARLESGDEILLERVELEVPDVRPMRL